MLLKKPLCLKGEKCSGEKLQRKTAFFHGFMSGEMEKLLVISKAPKL
jgi:hypothetical protein